MSIASNGTEPNFGFDNGESASPAAVNRHPEASPEHARTVYRIGVVDDHDLTIVGLTAMLAPYPDLVFAAGVGSVDELLSSGVAVDVVILDLRLNDGTTPERNIFRLLHAGLIVLVYTSGEDPYLLRSAARAGATGVVLKSERAEEVIAAIRRAATGGDVLGVDWALAIDGDEGFTSVTLSPQQRRVLELYASGETARRVARMTGLSEDTVNGYLLRIRQKYAQAGRPAQTKTELFKRALEDGWLPAPRLRWR